MTLGKRITQLRNEKSLTQEELANLIGVSRASLGMYEIDKREPDKTVLNKLADFFEVSVDYLFGRTNIRSSQRETKAETKAFHNLDASGLPEEAIRQVEEYIELIKLKYNSDGTLRKK